MIYVALLRGINVGGKNKVDMGLLRAAFERVGARDVATYINSGNVVFIDDRDATELAPVLEEAIEKDFGFGVKVLVRSISSIQQIVGTVPDSWVNDKTMKTDVWFLWDEVDGPDVVDDLPVRDSIDRAFYVDGAVVWHVADANKLTRSGRTRIVGTDFYRSLTARNINTVRKVASMMEDLAAG